MCLAFLIRVSLLYNISVSSERQKDESRIFCAYCKFSDFYTNNFENPAPPNTTTSGFFLDF